LKGAYEPNGGFLISPYFLFKCIVVLSYHFLVDMLGLHTPTFKFWSFLIAHAVVKLSFFNLRDFADQKRYLYSVAQDAFHASLITGCAHWIGAWYGLLPLFFAVSLVTWEFIQYRFVEQSRGTYVVHLSENWTDYSLIPFFIASFVLAGLKTSVARPVVATDFLWYLFLIAFGDAIFGSFHIWSHKNLYLWKKHMIHHRYKGEDLSTFANFYAELLDGILMNGAVLAICIANCMVGGPPVIVSDILFTGLFTHHKYPDLQAHSFWFFEFDILDMIFKRSRLSMYHGIHHNEIDKKFGAFGLVPDRFFQTFYHVTSSLFNRKK